MLRSKDNVERSVSGVRDVLQLNSLRSGSAPPFETLVAGGKSMQPAEEGTLNFSGTLCVYLTASGCYAGI